MNEIENLELKISKFLRLGVIVAAIFMLIGWILKFKWQGNPFFHFEIYDQIPFERQFLFYFHKKDWGYLFSYLGLIVLISLPLIRVLLTAVIFLKQKEYHLALIAALVLAGLGASFMFGFEL